MKKILLLGGSKSGKSMLAQQLTKQMPGPHYYLATMNPVDKEDEARIRNHLLERDGWGYETIEQSGNLQEIFSKIQPQGTVLLDSITSLLAEEMFGNGHGDKAEQLVLRELRELGEHVSYMVYVCDQIFSDGICYEKETENFRRSLAHICRALAETCDGVAEVCGGIPKWYRREEK